MEHKGYFMGIDAGTTGTTVLIMDEKWNVAAKGYQKHIMNSPKLGWMEQDANVLWEDLLCVVKKALSQLPLNARILGIGLDHQGESCLIWEKSTGNPLSQAINWQDRRTVSAVEELAAKYGEEIQKRTGFFPDSYFSAEKFVWELDQIPNGHQRAKSGELCAGTLGSWFLWKMTGGKIHMTDPSTASRTMLYNIHRGVWDDEILEMLSLPRKMLPQIGSSAQRFGMTQPQCFLGLQAPVSGLIVDQQAALFGQCCFHTGMIKTTYGTGCFLLMNTGQTPIKSPGGLLTTVAWNL
ncbi:MAG: FGGY family carbohydrate kinase, partial [Oscillospiraceae bacterium]